MAEGQAQRPPLACPPQFNSEGDMSQPNAVTDALTGAAASPGIKVDLAGDSDLGDRPALAPHLSAPAADVEFQSLIRHHKRNPSYHREIKETLNARSEYTEDGQDGHPHHVINQYVIKEEVGRGSYGAVHLATDQFGNEYAVKEFSKARLRKRVQSNILRLGPGGSAARLPLIPGSGLGMHRNTKLNDHQANEAKDPLFLIREEIAVMKKLNHPNLVQLIEVLDDPEEDSLYMVLEMCKKGVVMKVGLNDPADPYSAETCRCWFRDLILGIEYLHAQGVVHRDIKPDNLLLTEDDVLKISDFGVSEMFDKPNNMRTSKTAGSPAFLAPELCVTRHGDVDGKAADLWSMGVSLYCLRYGRIPFEAHVIVDMYDAIRNQEVTLPPDEDPEFVDLMHKILEKDPEKRITMEELRKHQWVVNDGKDPLLSAEENCAEPIGMPNPLEVNHAFTRKMNHIFCVMKAIHKFKSLLAPKGVVVKSHEPIAISKLHIDSPKDDEPPLQTDTTATPERAQATAEHASQILSERERFFQEALKTRRTVTGNSTSGHEKGHAHPLSSADVPFLGIGTGGKDDFVLAADLTPPAAEDSSNVVSESPTAVDFNVYDRAFEAEVELIKRSTSRRKQGRAVYKTRHLKSADKFFKEGNDVTFVAEDGEQGDGGTGTRENKDEEETGTGEKFKMVAPRSGPNFADLVNHTVRNARKEGQKVASALVGGDDGDKAQAEGYGE